MTNHQERKKTHAWQEALIVGVLTEHGFPMFHEQLYEILQNIDYHKEKHTHNIDCSLATFLKTLRKLSGYKAIVDNNGLNRLMARMDKKGLIKLEKLTTGSEKKCFLRRYSV